MPGGQVEFFVPPAVSTLMFLICSLMGRKDQDSRGRMFRTGGVLLCFGCSWVPIHLERRAKYFGPPRLGT